MKAIKIFLTLTFIIFLNSDNTFAQTWQWAKKVEGKNDVITRSITGDKIGNIYVAGTFEDSLMIIDTFNLKTKGSRDIFIIKYDSKGNVIWAKNSGGPSDDMVFSISVDKDGFVYIAGFYSYGIVYFEKYDSSGNLVWTKKVGTNDSKAYGITTDLFGNVYITGIFASPDISFDSIVLANHFNQSSGYYDYDIFIAKYSSNGKLLWAKSMGGDHDDFVGSITTDGDNNVYISGNFLSYYFSYGKPNSFVNSMFGPDLFVIKYDSSGKCLWGMSAGGNGGDCAYAMSFDQHNNIYVAGSFATSISFGNIKLDSTGGAKSFILKCDVYGNAIWAKKQQGYVYSISVDNFSNCFITGNILGTQMIIDKFIFTNNGGGNTGDIFTVSYDSSGNFTGANQIGGNDDELLPSVFADGNNNIYLALTSRSPEIYFDNIKLVDSRSPMYMACVAKLNGVVGIENIEKSQSKISIYPNPFQTSATIQLQSGTENSLFTLYNIFGEEVKRINFSSDKIKIERDNLSSGIYFYRLQQDNNKSLSGKLIISQ